MSTYNAIQLSILDRLFSATVFRELAKKGRSALFRRLLGQADWFKHLSPESTVGEVFDYAFDSLKSLGCRNEYIYRAAISEKILLGKHNLRTASMLNEFRVGSCKADLVILNGTSTVYEIKSERDSLTRLANQVENYKRVFAKVNVITSHHHIDGVLDIVPNDVGVMCLSNSYTIKTIREAKDCTAQICPMSVFESLRINESIAILQALGIEVPEVPNTQRHAAVGELFAQLDPTELHAEMVRTLKKTRNLAPLNNFVAQLPQSLWAGALSISIPRSSHANLIRATGATLQSAMTWS